MRTNFLVSILAFCLLGTEAGLASDKVWVGLYLGENGPTRPEAVLAPEKLEHRLHEVFGFKHYKLVKAQEIGLNDEWEQWVMPRKDFFIRVEPLPRQPGGPKIVTYEIYQNGFMVVRGRYEPREGMPLFINGPDFQQGRLIFVLETR